MEEQKFCSDFNDVGMTGEGSNVVRQWMEGGFGGRVEGGGWRGEGRVMTYGGGVCAVEGICSEDEFGVGGEGLELGSGKVFCERVLRRSSH